MSGTHPEVDKHWIEGWEAGHFPFHMSTVNPMLERHIDWLLNGKDSARILFPLCGKAVDMKWLADKGHVIVGIEGAELAVQQFFKENDIPFKITDSIKGGLKLYKSEDGKISLYVGNYYNIPDSGEESFDAVWDRGAMEAIGPEERPGYAKVMTSLMKPGCRILVEVAEREENKGPPFYIPMEAMNEAFGADFDIKLIDREDPFRPVQNISGFKLYSVEKKNYSISRK